MKLLSFILLIPSLVTAQTKISGKVTDARGAAVPAANVAIKGSYDGTSSDAKGVFSFTASETGKAVLSVTFIGYQPYEQDILLEGRDITLKITLKEAVNELNTVTITAGSIEASDEKKAVLLRPLDIVTTAGANGDIYGAIQTLPGTQPAGEMEGLFVRGGDASEAKTIIDGLPLQHPYTSSVPDIAGRGRFSPFLFKGTVFSTGGYSAQYGQAMSSALILETQDIAEVKQSTNIALSSVGLGLGHTRRWEKTSAGVDLNYGNLAPYFSIMSNRVDYDRFPQFGGGSFILRHKTSKTGMLKLYATQSFSDISIQSPIDNSGVLKKFELKNSNTFATLSYKELLSNKWSVFAASSVSLNTDTRNIVGFDASSSDITQNGKLMFTRSLGRLSSLRLGAEEQLSRYNSGSFQDVIYGYTGFRDTLRDRFYAGFAEMDWFLSSRLVARAGTRYEYSSMVNATNLAPRLSLAYKTGDKSQVSFAYGDFYQNPSLFYFANLAPGNSLGFEKATHYIANYQVVDNDRTFRVEAYYKRYSDLIKYDTLGTRPFRISNPNNSGTGYAQGLDIFWRDKKTFRYVDYWISYSYLDTRRNYQAFITQAQPTYAAKHTFNLVCKRFFPKISTSFGITYTYASGRPYYNPGKADQESFLSDRTPDFHNLSASASYLTNIKGHFTVIALSVSNILGIDNIFSYRYIDRQTRIPIHSPYPSFAFIGCFISIGKDKYEGVE